MSVSVVPPAVDASILPDGTAVLGACRHPFEPETAAHLHRREKAGAGVVVAVVGRPRPDGTPYRIDFGGAEITVSVQDEGGKIDLSVFFTLRH